MGKFYACSCLKRIIFVFLAMLVPLFAGAQVGMDAVDVLVNMGFENVACGEDSQERVYVLQNTAYRLPGEGVGAAIGEIRKYGLPEAGKVCKIIVLENNVPQVAVFCTVPVDGKELSINDWYVSYDLDKSWELVKNESRKNSSLYKVDILVYPEFSFRNSKLSVPYQVRLNMNPTVQVSLWEGSMITAQLVVPVVNQYGYKYDSVRPGFVTLSQTLRLPYNVFVTGSVGFFNNDRAGVDLSAEYHPYNGLFWVDGRISYTVMGEWGKWEYKNGKTVNVAPFLFGYCKGENRVTGQLGVNYYWQRFNTQFAFRGESYLEGDFGVRFDMIRHFKYSSIGFYGMYVPSDWWNSGINAGFRFQITLPPYKYKRKGYIPRIMPSRNWGFSYNAGGTFVYGQRFRADVDDNMSNNIKYNPYYLKSELLNF